MRNCPQCHSAATCYTTRDDHYRCRGCGILWTVGTTFRVTRNVGEMSAEALEAGASEELIRIPSPEAP